MQRAARLAKYLPRCGVDLHVIASSHAGTDPARPGTLYVPAPKLHTAPAWEATARFVQRIVPYNECLEWAAHAVHTACRIADREPIAAVISTSPPLGTHFAALFLKARYNLRWIADFRDPLCGNPGRSRRWAHPYDLSLERAIFHSADALVSVTDTVRDEWRTRYPRWREKMHLVWNGFDPEETIRPLPIPPRAQRVLAHIGVLYRQRHPYKLLDVLDRLMCAGRLDPAKFRLAFLGPIQEGDRFEAHAAVKGLVGRGSLEIRGELVPRAEANHAMATADFLLLIDIVNLGGSSYTVPAKIYDYILMGRPILALTGRQSPVERILLRSGVPHVCVYHNDCGSAMETKLLRLAAMSSEPVTPSAWFLENFDGERQAAMFADLVTQRGPDLV
ncbi:MAG TPA: glycosyltransferase [Bryobacteraceae bacterium]|nr:glycosyltransferase [Bryobacteraceae bacterium]